MDDVKKTAGQSVAPGVPAGRPGNGRVPAKDAISAGLRKLWAEVEDEPVPDDFMALLDKVDAARRDRKADPGAPA